MRIRKEPSRISFNLLHRKATSCIGSRPRHIYPRLEWSLQTPYRVSIHIVADWVRKRNTRRTVAANSGLVDVGSGEGRRLVGADDVVERDVVADGVGEGVDAVVESAAGSGRAGSWLAVGVNHSSPEGDNVVGRREGER